MIGHAVSNSSCSRRSFMGAAGAGFFLFPIERGWATEWPGIHRKHEPSLRLATDTLTDARPLALKVVRPPEFKRWPPHSPSARHVAADGISKYQGLPESDLLADVEDNLLDLGYPKAFYFALPNGGSAIAAPFERIRDDGAPINDDRFNLEPTSRWTILGRKPVPRRLRAIVFFLTSTRIPNGQPPMSFSKHRRALESGVNQLAEGMQFAAITQQHRLTTFIYEYFAGREEEPKFVERSAVDGIDHLKRSKIVN
jgi:hypothetical protein